ncbi:MAG: hypothetical protein ACKO9Z_13800 [Planctomycetota bacterium]
MRPILAIITATILSVWGVAPIACGQEAAVEAGMAEVSAADPSIPFWSPARLNLRMREVEDRSPSIRVPGPDTANYPNGCFTLPAGRSYVEFLPVVFSGQTAGSPSNYSAQVLLRHGITDWLEFRLFLPGMPQVQFGGDGQSQVTGVGPLTFDTKIHLFDGKKEFFLPAFGIELALQTNWASPAFNSGVQPAINLLFDHSLPLGLFFEWNVGVFGGTDSNNIDYYQATWQFSLQREVLPGFAVFVQAFINDANLTRFGPEIRSTIPNNATVVGAGFLWTVSDLFAVYASGGAGVTKEASESVAQIGMAFAF